MSGFTTSSPDHLVRSELWSDQLKDVLLDELMGSKYVSMLNNFPDGDTFTIPSVGSFQVDNYAEDSEVQYRAMDTGEYQFQITEYLSSGTYVTNKQKQDSFYMGKLMSEFVPKQSRAIMERFETDVMALANEQTADDTNTINGAYHRFVAGGTSNVISIEDFAKARYALKKANVPQQNLIAIVDPSVAFELNTQTNLVNVSNNPRWEGIIADGIDSGPKFVKSIFGFDVYESNYLAEASETIDGTAITSGKANMFFSATSDVLPFIGAWRQMPKVDSEYNKNRQREEYVTTARYGVDLYRPENLVTVLSAGDQVYS